MPVDGGRTVDLAVRLEPAPSHTIAGELGYGTGEGARIEASWTARNFFNPEGALTLRGIAGTSEQLAAVQFRRSNFLQRDQVLNIQASAAHQKFAAYEAKTIQVGGNIERQSNIIWQKKWTWTLGAELLATDERGVFSTPGVKDTRTFLIAALPARLGYDGSDNLLDPTRGFRLERADQPRNLRSRRQLRVCADADRRQRLPAGVATGSSPPGASGWARSSAPAPSIAPSRRLYSGGGGSVRGYGYQQLGPHDIDGDPIGGRGLAEFALEARIRLKPFGGNFGIVPFFDGGALTTKTWPDFKRLAVRGRHRRALLFELRPDPDRRRHAAQPRRRATAGRGRSCRSARRSKRWPKTRSRSSGAEPPRRRLRQDWPRRLLDELLALFLALLILFAGALVLLDTAPGHRFIVDRLARFETASGLNIRIGRIEGRCSASRSSRMSRVADGGGVFLTSPEIELDWAPGAWLYNSLHIDRMSAQQVELIRLPKLKPSARKGPILPGFDIHIGELAIDRLELGPAVTGQAA